MARKAKREVLSSEWETKNSELGEADDSKPSN